VLLVHKRVSRAAARERSLAMLRAVGIPAPEQRIDDHPHQLSGGMRQRVMIAMALLCEPALLIADEPTTALDVTIQAQILDLLRDRREAMGLGVVLITHDLGVVAEVADRAIVMYAGRIVEEGPVSVLLKGPHHPYTLGLLRSIPRLDRPRGGQLDPIPGLPPSLARVPPGCAFHPRCSLAIDACRSETPLLRTIARGPRPHRVACHLDDLSGAAAKGLA
jgi:peptide/nickel transport system ATP-binding protein/oligopeptide transport system ATP-binding protein